MNAALLVDSPLRAVLETLPAGIAIYDPSAALVYANSALWSQAGVDAPALPFGTPAAEVMVLLSRGGSGGSSDAGETFRNAAGRWHRVTTTPLPGGGFVTFSVDITGQRGQGPAETATLSA